MVDAIWIVATGASASVMVEGRDEDEWRKRLTAKLREIPSILLIDNCAGSWMHPRWPPRSPPVLGGPGARQVRDGPLPIRCVWIATGNNPQFSNEIARRMVRIRLDPHEDEPWLREGFRHPNLLAWVWQNRARLVAACLTLGRAWIAAGMPRHGKTIGSFEGWSEVMGGILEVAGVPGFLGNLKDMYERADAEGAVWRGFVALWWDRFGTRSVTAADLYDLALLCSMPLARGDEHAKRTSLGKALGRMRDRIYTVNGRRLRVHHAGSAHGAQRWQLQVSESDAGSTSPASPHESGAGFTSPPSPVGGEGPRTSPDPHPEKPKQNQCPGEFGEGGEVVSPLRVRAHARAMVGPGKSSPTSPGSPTSGKPPSSGGEVRGGASESTLTRVQRPMGGADMNALAIDLLQQVSQAGGTVGLEGDMLRLSAPQKLPDHLRPRLRQHKAEIVALLSVAEPVLGAAPIPIVDDQVGQDLPTEVARASAPSSRPKVRGACRRTAGRRSSAIRIS